MSVLYVMVAVALLLAGAALLGFIWAARRGQFDDLDTPAMRAVFDDEPDENENNLYLHRVERDDAALGAFKTFLQAGLPRCGAVRDAQRAFLFGEADVEVGSAALIPLGQDCEIGFLAIGCRDPDHFHPGKSIDFLTRIGELVAAALSR